MRVLKLLSVLSLFIVTGCTPVDPSVRDLKSPCVSNDFFDGSQSNIQLIPCAKRSPIENLVV